MKRFLIFTIVCMIFLSCEQKQKLPTQEELINKMNDVSNLGTVEYSLSKIVQVNDKRWYAVGVRKILINCKANVKAGIDFTQIKVIEKNDSLKSIKVEIPDAKLLLVSIPPDEIKIVCSDIGFFRWNFSNEELNEIQKQAEQDINNKIQDLNILSDARKNGKLFLMNFLKNLGFQRITILENNIIITSSI
jgi:hypothetical protein